MPHDNSRTSNSIRNGKYAVVFNVLNMLLGFVSRRVFIHSLGAELLGMNSTLVSFLDMLNLAELGIGTATGVLLYKPLYDGDMRKVAQLVALQGWLYRKVALFVGLAAVALMFFLPHLFRHADVPLWAVYSTFVALLVGSLLSYFCNYKQVLLSADQNEYLVTLSVRMPQVVRQILQILAVLFLPNAYVWWVALYVVFAVVSSVMLSRNVQRVYPSLSFPVDEGRRLKDLYPEVITKVKQIFVHRLASVALRQCSSIVIFTYASLSLVAAYGNYMLLFTGVIMLVDSVFNGIQAGVGNLVAQGDKNRTLGVFYELFALRFFVATVCSFCFLSLSAPFVSLWVGPDMVLSPTVVVLMSVMLFIDLARSVVDSYLSALGLFSDVWAPIAETVLNVGLSFLLGFFWGVEGIITGVIASLVVVVLLWKPYFLFRRGMHGGLSRYWVCYVKFAVVSLGSVGVCHSLLHGFAALASSSCISFVLYAVAALALVSLVAGFSLCVCSQSARGVALRIKQIVLSKLVA